MSANSNSTSHIIFPSASFALKEALCNLSRNNLSVSNRLRSIRQDSQFVAKVSEAYCLPLVANERCGSWYISPEKKAGSVYFKSTDGHFGQWAFSLRRLNLTLLDVVGENNGCVIVDSTRRGKSMPDALSKTVPIWATVLNRLLFPEHEEASQLRTPLDVVSESEHAQIDARLNDFVREARSLNLDIFDLRKKLKGEPLSVTWQRPGDGLSEVCLNDLHGNLLVLCVASNQTSNITAATSEYVQGAADDPEAWSMGLDSAMFWQHQQQLLDTPEDDLPELIAKIVSEAESNRCVMHPVLIKPTCNLWIASRAAAEIRHHEFDIIICCCVSGSLPDIERKPTATFVHLECRSGKIGSRQLRTELQKIDPLVGVVGIERKVLISCESGNDFAVGIALALLCLCYQEDGSIQENGSDARALINKTTIKQRLSWIMVSMASAAPSRATLQSVNAFLMG